MTIKDPVQAQLRLAKELALQLAVRSAVSQNFALNDESRIRRYLVQDTIAKHLGIEKNPKLSRMVFAYMEEIGVRATAINGYPYYSGIEFIV